MHAPGIPPQHGHQPDTAGVVAWRVIFALLPVLSCGFLAWGSMLRLAIVTRATRDWMLLAVSCALSVGSVVLIGLDPTPDTNGWQGNTGAGGIILSGFATCAYFLVADIRHHERRRAAGPQAHWYPAQPAPYAGPQQTPAPGYGYPPAQTTVPMPLSPQVPPQPPQPTPPPRIGQVRAELDELSELLRKQTPPPGSPYQDPNQTAIQDPNQ
ncbi:hypothetical protein OG765_21540 [Streptomyces sp. NBC_00555]|uniref:hypothetical protein n=1 Tax=Streptomyces sp. NBC_00555 TaxID=2903662 RepID=UPI0022558B6D|nr:hypothetical protein [Streptomyces sp. NBC_00555]MCX5013556.1 hypothetical protein [Streptomyces sp. NBC_00555]